MTNWKSMFFRLVELARPEKTVNDEAEIIGWASHEDGQHYPIHAAQGGGGSSGASSGGGHSGGGKSSQSSGGGGKMSSGGGEKMKFEKLKPKNEITGGSEKQKKWAEDIRNSFYNVQNTYIEQYVNQLNDPDIPKTEAGRNFMKKEIEHRKAMVEAFEKASKGKSAKWYIDNRGSFKMASNPEFIEGLG